MLQILQSYKPGELWLAEVPVLMIEGTTVQYGAVVNKLSSVF